MSCQHATSTEPAGNPAAPAGHDDDLGVYRTLLECLEAVPEPRRRRGIRHRLAVVLAFAVAAVLAGADSVTAISEWAAAAPVEVLAALGARRDRRRRWVAPAPATFRRVLKRVDATAVAAAFGGWLSGQVSAESADLDELVIALDGKTMRGARSGEQKAPHLLAAMICGARAVIAQRDVDQKTNEITQVKPLLEDVVLRGALVTADAMHVQRETARYLVDDKGADYLFTAVKDNQPGLFAVLDALDWAATPIAHTAADRGHGRDETRTLQVLPAPAGCFPHAAQAFLIERTVRDPDTGRLRSAAAALGITSRSPERGGTPTLIATAARSHWDIEALHHVRDVTMHEDAHRLRAGSAAPVMATLRNAAIATLRMIGFNRTAQGRRWAARDATRPVAALGLTI